MNIMRGFYPFDKLRVRMTEFFTVTLVVI